MREQQEGLDDHRRSQPRPRGGPLPGLRALHQRDDDGCHAGHPWVDECLVLISRHRNVYLDMSFLNSTLDQRETYGFSAVLASWVARRAGSAGPRTIRDSNSRRRCCPSSRSSTADRKSTRLNSSHITISYAVFCLKKKNKIKQERTKQKIRQEVTL